MKRTVILVIAFLSFTFSFSQTLNQEVVDDKGKVKLLGKINKDGLLKPAYSDWFNKNYDDYLVNDKVVAKTKDSLKNYTIKAFLGTWCGDSKRQVPRLYSVLEAANFPTNQLEVIALDKTKEAYKQSPNNEEKGLNIHRVPTFIFYKDGKEVNRIVESPVETLERDILKIVTTNKYASNYRIVNYMTTLFKDNTLEDLRKMETDLLSRLPDYLTGSKELNTFGYMLLRSNQLKKAHYIFDLNTKMFPNKGNVYDSLGEFYFETKNYNNALKTYYKVLSLSPEDKGALDMIAEIKAAKTTEAE